MPANAQTSVPTFTAAAVLTAEQQNLSARTGVPVFATATTRDAAFGGTNKTLAEGQLCYLESTDVVQYYTGAAWATVGPSAGQVLTVTKTDTFSLASSTFTDVTGLTITTAALASATSRVKINVAVGRIGIDTSLDNGIMFRLMRGSTPIAVGDASGSRPQASFTVMSIPNNNYSAGGFAFFCVDSPASATAITYKLQMATQASVQGYLNRNFTFGNGTNVYDSVTASTITITEIL